MVDALHAGIRVFVAISDAKDAIFMRHGRSGEIPVCGCVVACGGVDVGGGLGFLSQTFYRTMSPKALISMEDKR